MRFSIDFSLVCHWFSTKTREIAVMWHGWADQMIMPQVRLYINMTLSMYKMMFLNVLFPVKNDDL